MSVRLLVGVALVANVFIIVVCTGSNTYSSASSISSSSATSYSSSRSSAKTVATPKPKCRTVKKCPKNEEFSYCPQSMQRAQYCSEKAEPYRSTGSTAACEEGCVCKVDFLRADNGTCIPAGECPLTCGTNEVLDNCPTNCNSDYCPTEESNGVQPSVMPDVCPPPVCKCTFNHRRAFNGSCIPTRDCPPFDCSSRPNEEYNPCPPLCPTDDCSQASPTGGCPPRIGRIGIVLPCNPKCRCIKGYWRLNGICVPYGQCPGVCPANERYSECIEAECRALNCTQKYQSVPCVEIDQKYCTKGCVCEKGYLRNQDGICVLEDKCEPPSCPVNEEFVECMQGVCRAKDCSERGEDVPCPDIPEEQCDSGCICKENFLRADNGSCVPEDQCPITCDDNEVLDNCPNDCESDYCPTNEDSDATECAIPDVCPPPACKCAFNHRRAANGSCIPTENCPSFDCSSRPNEEYNPCPPLCPTDDCSQASPSGDCPPHFGRIGIVLPCSPKCRCIKGYWRLDGICVPYGQCPGVCPKNERYSECIQAECRALNCTQKDQSVPCIRMDPKYCKKGCVCEEGYLRNQDGICVLEDKCEQPSCPVNEEFVECMQGVCRAKDCSERGEDVPCPDIPEEQCDSGCICKENFLRTDNGSCVPEDQCPITCDDNEVLDNCPNDCESDYCPTNEDSDAIECAIPDVCPPPACKCAFNHRRAANGSCIPTENCPSFDCSSRPNEEYNPCPPFCPTDDCSQASPSGDCPPHFGRIGIVLPCSPKCRCIKGFWRLDGICVPYGQCPGVCPKNERYSECIQAECRALNCTQKDQSVPCIRMDPKYCKKGCVCEEGYLRNQDGICVLEDKCEPPVCPPNEEWSTCAQAICRAQKCTQLGKPIACPMIMEGYCEQACVCKPNFLRNETGDCIPEEQCPCPDNEVMDSCPMICNTDYCPQSADVEQACYQADPCTPACKCAFNYKRAENGTCIPTRDCPPFDCSAKPNEEYVACPPICPSDACGKPRLEGRCPFRIGIVLKCNPKCQCKDGYGRLNGTCVPFEDCPDLCPDHEEYSSCVQETCRPQNCSDRDLAMETCPSCDAASCKRGCVCQENFYRNDKGVCISYEECGGPMCPYAHEVYTTNFMECPPNICKSLVSKYACDENQKVGPGCLCESGYLRLSLSSPCIPICDCPEMANSLDC